MSQAERELGRWRLVDQIDETTHSIVWRGQADDGSVAAVKELKVRNPEKEPYQRFKDEVALLLMLGAHPGVLPIIEANVPDNPSGADPAWLSMPIAQTLPTELGESPTLDEVVAAIAVCARTLAELHAKGIFHRDLKPNNLFAIDGEPLVGDFGIATWPEKQALTEAGDKLGPAHFIAPEMVTDPSTAESGPADVWSLAKTLWVLAVGQRYPPPGQLRVEQPATSLRQQVRHERAALLEPVLAQATRLEPARRPTMPVFADELEAWLAPPVERRDSGDVDEVATRVRAITEPAIRAEEEREIQGREMMELYAVLREGGLHRLYAPMEKLGRVSVGEISLILVGLGGGSGRNDAIDTMAESFALSPHSNHNVSLTADVAYQLFDDSLVYLVAGIYLRAGAGLPEVFWMDNRNVPLGTQLAARGADELAQELNDQFRRAAVRFAELLEEAEAEAQQNRQPALEAVGENYIFKTEPHRAGHLEVLRRTDGSRDGFAVAWDGAPLLQIEADGDRLRVRTANGEGWITKSFKGHWSMSG